MLKNLLSIFKKKKVEKEKPKKEFSAVLEKPKKGLTIEDFDRANLRKANAKKNKPVNYNF